MGGSGRQGHEAASLPWEDPDWTQQPEDKIQKYAGNQVEDLKVDKESNREARELESQRATLRSLHIGRVKHDQTRAKYFFCLIFCLVILLGLLVAVTVVTLLVKNELTGNVAIAFFTSVVAQILGLAYIVAKHYFPEGEGATKFPDQVND